MSHARLYVGPIHLEHLLVFPLPSPPLPSFSDNAVVHLNYAVALYNAGETQQAAKQFSEYEALVKKNKGIQHFDPEVCVLIRQACIC